MQTDRLCCDFHFPHTSKEIGYQDMFRVSLKKVSTMSRSRYTETFGTNLKLKITMTILVTIHLSLVYSKGKIWLRRAFHPYCSVCRKEACRPQQSAVRKLACLYHDSRLKWAAEVQYVKQFKGSPTDSMATYSIPLATAVKLVPLYKPINLV